MPIISTDIKYRLSGGAANSDVNAALGGAKSSVEVTSASLHNLFDIVSSAEALAGDIEYRCIYVHNGHATITLKNAKVFIQTQTPSPETSFAIALDGAGLNGTAEGPVANENTAPSGEVFTAPADYASGLSLGDLAPGQHYAVWVRRTIDATCDAANADSAVLRAQGDTLAS